MKVSKYNVIYKTKDKIIIFNTLTGGMAYLEPEVADNLESNFKIDMIEPCIVKILKEQSYIIDNIIDEDQILEYQYLQTQFDKSRLGLVVAPTMDCNFACPYCYENRKKKKMSLNIQDKIIKLIEEKVLNGVKTINVTWYGGEPLIYPDVIQYITSKVLALASRYKIRYSAYIITNGYLINKEIIQLFNKNRIKGAQITIDGPPDIHNKRRILRDGRGTFHSLLNNIKLLLEHNIDVTIRMNIDKENANKQEDLLKILSEEGLNKCRVALGHVQSYTPVCQSIEGSCLNRSKFRQYEYYFALLLQKYNFPEPYEKVEMNPKSVYCGAVMENYYVFDPEGYIYKCWNDISVREKSIGQVGSKTKLFMVQNDAKYLTWNPFKFKNCKNCLEKPLCMGGCPFMSMKGRLACEKYSKIFAKYINLYIAK